MPGAFQHNLPGTEYMVAAFERPSEIPIGHPEPCLLHIQGGSRPFRSSGGSYSPTPLLGHEFGNGFILSMALLGIRHRA